MSLMAEQVVVAPPSSLEGFEDFLNDPHESQ